LKKSYSLKGKRCFNGVFQNGRRFRTRGLQCTVTSRCGVPGAEGFSCSRKTDLPAVKVGIIIQRRFGKAHDRNRAKRQLRAICDCFLPSFNEGYCLAVKINDEFKDMSFIEARANFEQMMKKAGVLK
jgi:ribonuclease P protein component